jgi:hypothetical protein
MSISIVSSLSLLSDGLRYRFEIFRKFLIYIRDFREAYLSKVGSWFWWSAPACLTKLCALFPLPKCTVHLPWPYPLILWSSDCFVSSLASSKLGSQLSVPAPSVSASSSSALASAAAVDVLIMAYSCFLRSLSYMVFWISAAFALTASVSCFSLITTSSTLPSAPSDEVFCFWL